MSKSPQQESGELGKSLTGCNDQLETIVVENKLGEVAKENVNNIVENKKGDHEIKLTEEGDKLQHVKIDIHEEGENNPENKVSPSENESTPQILINQPLCADYGSSSDTESDYDSSSDSDSDSSTADSDSDSSSQVSSDDLQDINDVDITGEPKSQQKNDLDFTDLPPIENLRISVPEEECQEMGIISSIVNTLVVVQAYKDSPALDIDTVLFLDMGQKSLGRIFDVLGPVSEPLYTVRFNNVEEIAENSITKGMKVYCAPKTEYTSFVFVSELMKMKGSDASWENNEEPPPEYQDFSDDEEERKFRHGGKSSNNSRRKSPSDGGNRKKSKLHGKPNKPGRPTNYRNPFAMGQSRDQTYGQTPGRYPPRHPPGYCSNPPQPPYPDQNNQVYAAQNNFRRGGMTGQPPLAHPPYPNYSQTYSYPYQQYPSYPMHQFAMPPVMPPPPPPPAPANPSQHRDNPARTQTPTRVFGSYLGDSQRNG